MWVNYWAISLEHSWKYLQVGQHRNSNDKAKKDKWSDAEEEEDAEDKGLILGKYKYLEEVPREVCIESRS